ncbi:glycoside hydrolase family 15 protein [Kocuria rhizophila]|uniref:glycoside hydrolase family 15 protein n=1 Tax=Kocuria rhizophila TaxID=72000 RepID=UPI001C9BE79F|nr:glycoside hydrolase family 15 protein [Kocuria rhizophila]MCT1957973.1 glycoside hydrolase family 15 protein [Kocuria rhizophila]MCT2073930.1 glycoside hydrolase family 15 protein [Kocuria rhizophila]
MSTPLKDYALLADLHTGPLVSREGSIDWLCFPRFDSPAVFCALLGDEDNGRWKLSAVDGEVVSRRYVPDTFILETEWQTPTGRVLVTDFLPPSDDHADLVRRVKCLDGTVEVEHDLRFRFDYGQLTPWVRRVDLDHHSNGDDCAHMGDSPSQPHPVGTAHAPHTQGNGRPEGERAASSGESEAGQDGHGPHWYSGFRERVHRAARAARSRDTSGQGLLAVAGPDALLLTGPALEPYQLDRDGQDVAVGHDAAHGPGADIRVLEGLRRGHRGTFRLDAGEQLDWVLTWSESYRELLVPADPDRAQQATHTFWTDWASAVDCDGEYHEIVKRSLLVLRALTHSETGGIVAAPTAGLPEEFGGSRNWDYRYTWLRDAALTITALVQRGHEHGALLWRDWLLRAVAGNPDQLRILYGVDGRRNITESELGHLPGYEGSRPVRIGNGAECQYQADVAGEVMMALATLRDAGHPENDYSWGLQCNLMSFCELHMDTPDNGIWEMRGEPQFFTHGRVMMWAAFNEGLRAVKEHGLTGDVERWTRLRDELHREIWEKGYDEELGIFTQTYANREVDASLLQLPQTGFIEPDHPAMLRTVARIEQDLQDEHGQLRRYRTTGGGESMDGLSGHEYPFVICTFWLVEQYARSGRLEDARELMRTTAGFASDLGLLSEEYDVGQHRLAGNFPQAFSHLGLIRAADALEQALRAAG